MAKTDVAERKYFFDRNNFDTPRAGETAPAVFSEEELSVEKARSLEDGKRQGMAEATRSREKQVADALSRIAQGMATLFAAESVREKLFEEEAVRLTAQALSVIFPILNKRYGMDELKSTIREVLRNHEQETGIAIEVSSECKDEIEALIAQTESLKPFMNRVKIEPKDGLPPGDCRLIWKNGGAVRDTGHLVGEILRRLEQLLPPTMPQSAIKEENQAGKAINPSENADTIEGMAPTGHGETP